MCQLTFTNLGDEYLNTLYTWVQLTINTTKLHQDGFGFFSRGSGLYKSENFPYQLTDLGNTLRENLHGHNPVMAHVRQATFTNGDKKVDAEHSHPFETENIILAHNGSLEPVKKEEMKLDKYKDMIDSQIFLHRLQENITNDKGKNTSLVSLLKNTMEEFNGKFAFLIFDKRIDKYYIVRGLTAELHYVDVFIDGKKKGFVINTSKESLIDGLLFFSNILQIQGLGTLDWREDSIKLLEQEAIFYVDESRKYIKKVGDIKETKEEVAKGWNKALYGNNYHNRGNVTLTTSADFLRTLPHPIQTLYGFMDEFNISVQYLDELCYVAIGKGLLQINNEELIMFTNILDLLTAIADKGPKNLSKDWKKVANGVLSMITFHNKHGIVFPYMLVDDIRVLRELKD